MLKDVKVMGHYKDFGVCPYCGKYARIEKCQIDKKLTEEYAWCRDKYKDVESWVRRCYHCNNPIKFVWDRPPYQWDSCGLGRMP